MILVGRIPNDQLVNWYNAADLFFLGSSREGWPNVVCESLACGTPVVATRVNGIPEILHEESLGIMVDRSVGGFTDGLMSALVADWDSEYIARQGQLRTWDSVADEIYEFLSGLG